MDLKRQSIKVIRCIGLIALCILSIIWDSHAQKQVVLVKVYNQELEPFRNEQLAFDGGLFTSLDKNGQLFMEFNANDLPPKSVHLKNPLFEVATWSYSKGKLEIVIRPRTSRSVHLTIFDEQRNPISNVRVRYQKNIDALTDANGSIDMNIPVNSRIQMDLFEVEGYEVISIESVNNDKYIIQTQRIYREESLAKTDSVPFNGPTQHKPRKMALADLDSIQSFSELYGLFSQLELKKIDERLQQRLNDKFRELLGRTEMSKAKSSNYVSLVTDSSKISDDIMNLLRQAKSDRDLIGEQRKEFDRSAQAIQDKLSAGIGNLNEAERSVLVNDFEELELILRENEQFFSENHEYYRGLLSMMKDKFFDISALENKLTISEARRLKEQKQFRERILFISALVLLFGILVVLLMRSESRLRKVNQKISEMNENLETMVMQRTKMLMLANKELDTFLYRASHDLRSPVCSIIGLCNIASHVANPESLDLLEKVTGTVKIMDKLLKKLSVISEINEPSSFGKINAKERIVTVLKSFEGSIAENEVNVTIQCDENLSFYSYPNLLDVVLSNIIENALFYSLMKDTANARIDILARGSANNVQIEITDNGIGVDNTIKSRLFDMFFKGNENSKGNGLGLYIVYKSIQALKGEVEVESQPGHYTRFIISLPVDFQEEPVSRKELVAMRS